MIPSNFPFDDLSYLKLAIWAGGLLLLLWIAIRARSLHMMLELIWRLLFGRRNAESRRMRAFYQERAALMHFRWVTNIPARTLREARALVAWCHAHDEELADVRSCGDYFDRRNPGLRVAFPTTCPCESRARKLRTLPGYPTQIGLMLIAFVLCLGIALTAFYATFSGAIVSVKGGSGIQLVLYSDHFSLLHQLSASYSAVQCQHPGAVAQATGLPASEVRTACDWLSNPTRGSYVAKTVTGQRIALLFLAAVLAWLAFAVLSWLRTIFSAGNMRIRLATRVVDRPQTN